MENFRAENFSHFEIILQSILFLGKPWWTFAKFELELLENLVDKDFGT